MVENSTGPYVVTAGMNESFSINKTGMQCSWTSQGRWVQDIQPVFLWLLAVVGVVENSFVLSVLCLHKNRCTVAEIYLANLAAADLLLLCSLPFWAIYMAHDYKWPFGMVLCKVINSMASMNLYSSIYFLVMVSIDRYLALVKTMSLGRLRRPCCAKWNCLVIWVSSALLCSPAFMFRSLEYDSYRNASTCLLKYPSTTIVKWEVITNTLLNIVGFLLPLCIITYCSIQVILVLKNNNIPRIKAVQTEKRATILVLLVLLLFVICWLPFQITTLLDTLLQINVFQGCDAENLIAEASQIAAYCSFSNSCLNPIVYVIVGKHFRKKSKEVYLGFFFRRPSAAPSIQMMTTMETLRNSFSMENLRKKSAVNLFR